ncbi:MAG TPA: Flp family type IVb pilin [Thermomicrobiaceae bacterium]|nr:Flp family type IVb pilin [Thermomicrobiaceae bacterium]
MIRNITMNSAAAQYLKALIGMYLPETSEGQGMVEYGLILVLVSVVVIGILGFVGGSLTGVFTTINDALGGAAG